MGAADGFGIGGVGEVRAGADDVGRRAAEFGDGGENDLETAPGLRFGVAGRAGAVGFDRRGAGDEDMVADADRAGEIDLRLVGRAGPTGCLV